MKSDWRQGKLGDFIELKRGYDLPQVRRIPGAYPLISSSGVTDTHNEAMVKGPGVITGRYGTIGQVFFTEHDFWPLNTTLYVQDFKGNDPRFVQYFLKTIDFHAHSDKAAVPGVNRNHLHETAVRVPSLPLQRQIAGFLGDFDDRIALLRETNATLEALAQALFKSWFVDFDPVRAKMEGHAAEGMDEGTFGIFPNALRESSGSELPTGWSVGDLASLVADYGGTIQTGPFGSQLHASDYVPSGIPVVMPKDIDGRRISSESIAKVSQDDADRLARHKLLPGDIVFSRRGDVEKHALITPRETGWLCGTGCLLVRPGTHWPSPTFLSMLLDAPDARAWLTRHAVGATMPNLNTGILGSVPVRLPTADLLKAFESIVGPLESKRSENLATAETLSALRDTLLPRLISGRLRLEDVPPGL